MAEDHLTPGNDTGGHSGRTARRATDVMASSIAGTYLSCLLAADRKGAEHAVDRAIGIGVEPTAIHTLIIQAAMERIGELWEQEELSVADEHLATAISHQVLVRMLDVLRVKPPCSREHVLLAAVQGQQHVLGLRMVADVLEGAGFNVLYLGADVPIDALRLFAAQHNPAIVGLSFGIAENTHYLAEAAIAVRAAAPRARLMLGGRAVPKELVGAGLPLVPNSTEVLAAVEAILAQPPQAIPPELEAMRAGGGGPSPNLEPVKTFPSTEEQLAAIAAESSEVAREFSRRAEAFRDLSLRDPVTELGNRRAFDDWIHAHCNHGGGGSLLLIDLDNFKAVNDSLGHEEGDRLLREVGLAITDTVRPNDFSARIGGDEFAVLLPSATIDDASEIGARIRAALERRHVESVTLSIGATSVSDDARATLLAVDQALYNAKAAGRNTLVAAEDGSAPDLVRGGDADGGAGVGVAGSFVCVSRQPAANGFGEHLLAAFRRHQGTTDELAGLQHIELWRSDAESGALTVVSHWRLREDFERFVDAGNDDEPQKADDGSELHELRDSIAQEVVRTYDVIAT